MTALVSRSSSGHTAFPCSPCAKLVTGNGEMNEIDRMEGYQAVVGLAANLPFVVGVHYRQYNDLPVAGRSGDGAQQAIGFVDAVDHVSGGSRPRCAAGPVTVRDSLDKRRSPPCARRSFSSLDLGIDRGSVERSAAR